MRSTLGTATLLLALATLTACGADGGDADDVPTITTRPSATSSATSSSSPAAPTTTATEPSPSATESQPTEIETTATTVAPPTSAPPPDEPNGPATYDDAVARIDGIRGEAVSTGRFVTPDDDVYCLLADPVLGPACELGNGFITDPEVCGADSTDRVGRIETVDGTPRPVCNADTIREPGARLVRPDRVVVDGDVRCGVEPFGVTCIDRRAEVGFFIGKGEYHVF